LSTVRRLAALAAWPHDFQEGASGPCARTARQQAELPLSVMAITSPAPRAV